MTPANSEAPREAVGELGLLERYDGLRERAEERGGHYESRIAGNDFSAVESVWVAGDLQPDGTAAAVKVSSPELASLAATYVGTIGGDLTMLGIARATEIADDVRSLAASVLAQAEGTPRK